MPQSRSYSSMRWSDRSVLTGPTIAANARTFWERKVAEDTPSFTQESDVWNNIYGTIRDRRRSRSRASSSSVTRSRTPSSVSSGRTTPSPGPQLKPSGRTMSEETLLTSPDLTSQSSSKYETACWLEARSVPVYYSSTILIQLGSTRKRYVEEIKFQKRLVPRRYAESMEMPTDIPNVCFTSEVNIPCESPTVHIIDLEPQQRKAQMLNHLTSNI